MKRFGIGSFYYMSFLCSDQHSKWWQKWA